MTQPSPENKLTSHLRELLFPSLNLPNHRWSVLTSIASFFQAKRERGVDGRQAETEVRGIIIEAIRDFERRAETSTDKDHLSAA
ncbi:hypothetical protein TNCV_1625721 [Trichonephila clavipes]|nr:hypothetical protein TNCV_1625721 [Trichonephila clavipes]